MTAFQPEYAKIAGIKAEAKTLDWAILSQSNRGLKCAVSPLPINTPSRIIPTSDPILITVKMFCVMVPWRTPMQCSAEINSTTRMEKRVPMVTFIETKGIAAEKRTSLLPSTGKKNDMYSLKITTRKAIAPEKVTRNDDQPDRKPINLP